MSYRQVFKKKHALFIVVHVANEPQVLRNTRIALEAGADGVFLIDHRGRLPVLIGCYEAARTMYPNFWIGMNFLGFNNRNALFATEGRSVNGLWIDNVEINEAGDPYETQDLRRLQQKYSAQDVLIFGGVAFKYQEPSENPALAAKLTAPHIDVVTTSGERTGEPPDVEKIRAMKEAIGDHPLAIASGITPENVGKYLPHADCFLVATGVSYSENELNPIRVEQLVKTIQA